MTKRQSRASAAFSDKRLPGKPGDNLNMLEIDGSESHGGGSILRIASGLAVLTQTPIRITNIRSGRKNPGIQEQHLAALRALNSLCEGRMTGDEIGSKELEFFPNPIGKSMAEISISTAGSVALSLQPILIASASVRHPVRLKITGGGTMGKWAPPFPFLETVTFDMMKRMGYGIYSEVFRHGFYPKGGASVSIEISPPQEITPLKIPEPGRVLSVSGISIESKSLSQGRVAERQKYACQQMLEKYFEGSYIVKDFETEQVGTDSPGSCLTAWITRDNCVTGYGQVGEPGIRAEDIGRSVAESIIRIYESGATLDSHAADQILPFMLMAPGSVARIGEITGHMETSMWLSEKFLGRRFSIDREGGIISS